MQSFQTIFSIAFRYSLYTLQHILYAVQDTHWDLENIFLCDLSVLENLENGIYQLHIYVCIGIYI